MKKTYISPIIEIYGHWTADSALMAGSGNEKRTVEYDGEGEGGASFGGDDGDLGDDEPTPLSNRGVDWSAYDGFNDDEY